MVNSFSIYTGELSMYWLDKVKIINLLRQEKYCENKMSIVIHDK